MSRFPPPQGQFPLVGTATVGDVMTSKTFSSIPAGVNAAGTMPNQGSATYSASTSSQSGAAGYYTGITVNPVTGNAGAAQVLSNYGFSSANGIGQTGSMPNNGGLSYTPGTSNQSIPSGYTTGGTVEGDAHLVAGNILSGVSIFGVAGSVIQASGNAGAVQVLTGYTASNSSGGFSGSMPNNGSPTLNPGASITAGYYSGGSVASTPHGNQVFTASGSFTVPSNVTQVVLTAIGGGGSSNSSSSYPGGWGGAAVGLLAVSPGTVLTVTVGAGAAVGGVAGSSSVSNGSTTYVEGGGGGNAGASTDGEPAVGTITSPATEVFASTYYLYGFTGASTYGMSYYIGDIAYGAGAASSTGTGSPGAVVVSW